MALNKPYYTTASITQLRIAAPVKMLAHIKASKYLLKKEPEKTTLESVMHYTITLPFLVKDY